MWRSVVAGILIVVGLYVGIDALIKTEPERVEDEMERLLDLARKGGDDAVEEILASVSDDYRGSAPFFDRASMERRLRTTVGGGKVNSITTGAYKAIWSGDEITIPILRLDVDFANWGEARTVLAVSFAKEGDRWKIVNVTRWQMSR